MGFGGNIGMVFGSPRLDAETQQGALLDLLANPGQIGGEKAFPTEDFANWALVCYCSYGDGVFEPQVGGTGFGRPTGSLHQTRQLNTVA